MSEIILHFYNWLKNVTHIVYKGNCPYNKK